MTIRVRRARAHPDDVRRVTPLFDAYRQFYGRAAAPAVARRFLSERLRRGESVIFVAEVDRRLVGFVQLYPTFSSVGARRAWVLNDLYVEPGSRRTGAARRLMEAARGHALRTRADWIELATGRANAAAQALYESLGYVRDEEFFHYTLTLESVAQP